MSTAWAVAVVLAVALGASWLVILGLVTRLQRLKSSVAQRAEGEARGTQRGSAVVLPSPPEGGWPGAETTLIFVSPDCLACQALAEDVADRDLAATSVRFVVNDAADLATFEAQGHAGWWVSRETFVAAGIKVTPFALTVDRSGRVLDGEIADRSTLLARLDSTRTATPSRTN